MRVKQHCKSTIYKNVYKNDNNVWFALNPSYHVDSTILAMFCILLALIQSLETYVMFKSNGFRRVIFSSTSKHIHTNIWSLAHEHQ